MKLFLEDITSTTLQKMTETILLSEDNILFLFINSTGGDWEPALHFSSFLRSCNKKIITIITGNCQSSAIPILLAGEERWAIPSATFMLHRTLVTFGPETMLNSEDLKMHISDLKSSDRRFFEAALYGTTLSITKALNKVDSAPDDDWIFDSTTALKYSFITNIGIPQ